MFAISDEHYNEVTTIYEYTRKEYTVFSLTQLVCRWQHVSAYYKAIIRPSIDLIDQLCSQ
jgi:hypothetical protein